MPFEINDGRTPPTVLLTMSQSTPGGLEYERNSTTPIPHGRNRPIHKNVEQFKDVSNLKVNYRNRRSFTPVKNSLFLKSPELSPIDTAVNNRHGCPENARYSSPNLEQSLTPGDYKVLEQSLTPVEFKVPPLLYKTTNEDETPTRPHHLHHHNRPHKSSEIQLEDLNQTQSLDKSASHGYLNHNLEVRLILKNAGMQQYIEAFEKEKMDFGKFLSLCEEDLLRLGVERKVDRKVIFNIISDLNAN